MGTADCVCADGRLFGGFRAGGSNGRLFVFDSQTRKFTETIALPGGSPLDLGLCPGPGRRMIGFSCLSIYELDPDTLRIRLLVKPPGGIQVAGPILGRRIYFANGSHLFVAEI